MHKINYSQPIDYDYLLSLRSHEITILEHVLLESGNDSNLLNFGAGNGYQSKLLEHLGFSVSSLDLASSRHQNAYYCDVRTYDGINIPYPDNNFNIIFSSNVLEHISEDHIPVVLSELRRISKPGALHIHIMPTPTWRFYSCLTYYAYLLLSYKRFLAYLFSRITKTRFVSLCDEQVALNSSKLIPPKKHSPAKSLFFVRKFFSTLMPPSHGYQYSSFMEIFMYSSRHWRRLFLSNKFTVIACKRIPNLYTAYPLFGNSLPISLRSKLSKYLGASTIAYIIKA